MGKRLNGPMGPIKGGGGLPHWAWRQGWGPPPPWPAYSPPLGSLVPHGVGEEDGTPPLGLYKEGETPLFPTHQYLLLPPSPSRKWTPLVWSLHLDWSSPP